MFELQVEVVVLDANLTAGQYKGEEGKTILQTIRQNSPNVKVIGMSGIEFAGGGVDIDLTKKRFSQIGKVVSEI